MANIQRFIQAVSAAERAIFSADSRPPKTALLAFVFRSFGAQKRAKTSLPFFCLKQKNIISLQCCPQTGGRHCIGLNMKKIRFSGEYFSPTVERLEIFAERGFATSVFGEEGAAGGDLENGGFYEL